MSKNGKHGKERRPCPSGDPSTWQRHQTLCCYLRLKPTQGSADLNGTTVWDDWMHPEKVVTTVTLTV